MVHHSSKVGVRNKQGQGTKKSAGYAASIGPLCKQNGGFTLYASQVNYENVPAFLPNGIKTTFSSLVLKHHSCIVLVMNLP